ncbi:hypothetical protein OS175_04420 [Marinicella sp. S1101]|uniref:hypothetical protein n=1 Tax=Marinicella marina TaxID=2996016 RepID=UPI0022608ABC|nr:hypothetical protein [Marinicella marina]MCX7553112.1 hypothetical protein [Marinicella marina]MDJ1138844.1 hypothetical protein [Marinicella marina]
MGEFQTIVTVILALIIGFIFGRSSKKSDPFVEQQLSREEWNSLQPDKDNSNPYDDVHQDVLQAIESGNLIEAIKRFRQHHSASLKEAKGAVDAIRKNINS